ncbi:hypothetical protein [Halorubrum sp. F4]|uniref:hypothetical protein n=1 Tax=Halorubrum sp. F4 TaxID=2989715 RepID=UPI00248110C7|nr:hypothetical protein [Halorubrum sp. F4]
MSLAAVAGGALLALAAGLVHRDAARVGVDSGSPTLWAGLVLLTGGVGAITALLVPDAPLPGVLVVVALGPLLYVLERDDSLHGDDDPDPTRLPSATRDASTSSDDGRGRTGTDDGRDEPAGTGDGRDQ